MLRHGGRQPLSLLVNELLSVGLILLLALLAGHVVKVVRVPEVTGYILAGIALGPSGLHWLSSENVHIAARAAGKVLGAALAARWLRLPRAIRGNLGVALLSQAGLAIGLALVIQRRFPEHGPTLGAVVLGAVVVFELIGPISARFAIVRGERAAA